MKLSKDNSYISRKEKTNKKVKYKLKNWKEYDQSLLKRGSLTLWIPENVEEIWYDSGKKTYHDQAIELILCLKAIYRLPLRQTEGFVISLFGMIGIPLSVPDYTTVSRRTGKMNVVLKKIPKEKVDIILDSTGLKVFGEGEWKVKKHGPSKHRTWTKVHIGLDSDMEIRQVEVTGGNCHDMTATDNILNQEDKPIMGFWGDGAYDSSPVYMSLAAHDISDIHIPPRHGAKVRFGDDTAGPPYQRDKYIREMQKLGRTEWKKQTGYHRRSLSETTMFRYKTTFGERMSFCNTDSQKTEALIKCNILNIFRLLGFPRSYAMT